MHIILFLKNHFHLFVGGSEQEDNKIGPSSLLPLKRIQ